MAYGEAEIERIYRVAFELARSRRRKLTSVDKANVLDCSACGATLSLRLDSTVPDVKLNHMYVDYCCHGVGSEARRVRRFVLTENMFGDILSDQAGAVVGSLGMLGSASIGGAVGLAEPVHGSACRTSRTRDCQSSGRNPFGSMLLRLFIQTGNRGGLHRVVGRFRASIGISFQRSGQAGTECGNDIRDGAEGCRGGARAIQGCGLTRRGVHRVSR